MAAKKKKKAASNPARGFATTSIASKIKADGNTESSNISEAGDAQPAAPTEAIEKHDPAVVKGHEKDLAELTPEELEIQLEYSEFQLLVEKLSPKAVRDTARTLSRIKTERRVLLSNSQILSTKDWLEDEDVDHLMNLKFVPSVEPNPSPTVPRSIFKTAATEDLLLKLWTLQQILLGLYFPSSRVTEALLWICQTAPCVIPEGLPWGVQECLDWLTVNCTTEELRDFEFMQRHNSRANTTLTSPDKTLRSGSSIRSNLSHKAAVVEPPSQHAPVVDIAPFEPDDNVSDLDSDMEPDDMISAYLKVKSKLFEAAPASFARKGRGPQDKKEVNINSSLRMRKLNRQLEQLEKDVLFDQSLADERWHAQKVKLAQENAAKKRLGIDSSNSRKRDSNNLSKMINPAMKMTLDSDKVNGGSDVDGDEDLLGAMFTEPENGGHQATTNIATGDTSIKIRHFAEAKGLSPRRIVEETLKAMLVGAKATWKHISPTTYSSRHSVSIHFSNPPEAERLPSIPGLDIFWIKSRTLRLDMVDIATDSEKQSESFVATTALFVVCNYLPGDDKAYLRLPSVWRDLYKEFAEAKKEQTDAEARKTLKELRILIDEQRDYDEDEDVVLTHNFLKRAKEREQQTSDSDSERGEYRPTKDPEKVKALWQNKISTSTYQRMLLGRMQLPMYQFKHAALSAIENHQVIILCGETGCGKSTQLPAYILEHQLSNGRPCKIYCTEPRRISAISLAQRVSEELGEPKNAAGTHSSLVGYAIRLESHISTETRLVYATVGIVLRMLESPRGLNDITHLVIDEVHERSIDTDFLLIVLRGLMERRPDLRVILMSATVDAQTFSRYLGDAPILNVPGRTFPVNTRYLEDAIEFTHYKKKNDDAGREGSSSDDDDPGTESMSGIPKNLQGYSIATRNSLQEYDEYRVDYNLIMNLITKITNDASTTHFSKAFLVFLPGIAEIRTLNDVILNNSAFNEDWWILPLHSTIASEDQQKAFLFPPPGVRKIVLATNIAETGVTIPDVTCVIDTGKHKEMRFDERRQLSRLVQSFISRANAKQRRGRAGRVQEGLCFHLFTKYRHDELMALQQTPEMLRLSLQDLVMRTKICKLGAIEATLSAALDPPSTKNIRRAIDALVEVNALTPKEDLTPLGIQLAKLPLDAHLGKLVLYACIFRCADAGITIAAILSSKSPFVIPFGAREKANAARVSFNQGDSDLLTEYAAYRAWKTVCLQPGAREVEFCRRNCLSAQTFSAIEELKAQLFSSLVDAGFISLSAEEKIGLNRARNSRAGFGRSRAFVPVPSASDTHSTCDALVLSMLAVAFHPHILTRAATAAGGGGSGKGYTSISSPSPISLNPTSVLRLSPPRSPYALLSYHSILSTSSSNAPAAHGLSPVPILPFLLLAGDADFKVWAKGVVFDGNRLRYRVESSRMCVGLKRARKGVRNIVEGRMKNSGKGSGSKAERDWIEWFLKMFGEYKGDGKWGKKV
ncbi:ATP-dependent RNA helicase A [Pseudovirgaria hyperparasitica]|uniref:RNA helicase n=1 Tax=Pseudovirgaria hyperparasitica TaxID=470096 RepID=A0A6A6WEE4_9PEZI|nr:ATP-dependent RNA helicase A [Pseudovirgaria hyperparasitica]KAF2759957.1 ATP-dependent RNA helicase A [Pseudovirgaria hyperparasitica]